MNSSAVIDRLRALSYFDTLTHAALETLSHQVVYYHHSPGQIIFLEGEPAAGFWLIESGHVKIFKISPDGEEHILHLLGEGHTFNDIAALDGGPNPASAAALNSAGAWLVPTDALHSLIASDNALAVKMLGMMAARVRLLVSQIEDLALCAVPVRLARFLLKQAEDPALSGPGVTRAAIAAHLATTPETISRALRSLEKAGAIQFDRHEIVIVSEELLRVIAALEPTNHRT